MKLQNRGQILPACMILVTVLLWFLISNFKIGIQTLRKIQAQKKMDAVALEYGTQYARAINGLAALNEGLTIAANRGILVAEVTVAVAACAAAPLPTPCKAWLQNLRPRLPIFYKNLNKLGEELVKQQDQIIDWMIKERCSSVLASRLELNDFYVYPNFRCQSRNKYDGLPFYRPSDDYSNKVKGVKKCQAQNIISYSDFQTRIEKLPNTTTEFPSIEVVYISNTGRTHTERPLSAMQARRLLRTLYLQTGGHTDLYFFKSASMTYCTFFKNIFESINKSIAELFNMPSPLVFKNDFFIEQNRMILIHSEESGKGLDHEQPIEFNNTLDKVWALTEVKLQGEDFEKMEFTPKLTAVSLEENLWTEIYIKRPFLIIPNLSKVKNEINH